MQLPLSKIQEQFWVLGNLYPNSTAYNIPLVYKLEGKLCAESFKKALTTVFKSHSLLTAQIEVTDNTPFFIIPSEFDIENYFENINLPIQCTSEIFTEYILSEAHHLFKLNGDYLARVRYLSFSDSQYIVFVFHHIIIDHQSKITFLSEISRYYSLFVNGRTVTTCKTPFEYSSYVYYEKDWIFSNEAIRMRADWESVFKNSIDQIDLPFDKNSEMIFKSQGKRLHFSLYNEVSLQIDQFSATNNISPFVFLLSAYTVLLSRISDQRNFAVGVPLSNRRHKDFKNTFGCFINILPLVINLDKNATFSEIINLVRTELLKNHRRQEIPLVELQSIYNETQKGYSFHVGFTFEEPVEFLLENIDVQHQIIERRGSQLELFLTMWHSNEGYKGFWEFNTDKFNDTSGQRFIDIFKTIINEVLVEPKKIYLNYSILTGLDKKLIETVNNTKCPYQDNICIHQVFENKVAEIPHKIAIVHNNIELTYKELNIHVNQLANYLIDKNTRVGDIIGIACERRVEMIISILAVMKAGAAYLPIQVNNPALVTQEIINTANPKFILASLHGSKNINNKDQIISIEAILNSPYSSEINNPDVDVNSNNLAYIIFTSGSTGQPKGVAIKHHSVVNRLEWMQGSYPLTEEDVLLQKTPITFDVSVWELFWWFFGGAKLSLLEHDGEKDPMLIVESIDDYSVTKIHFVPSMFGLFIDTLKKQKLTEQIKSLKTIFCSGESLQTSMVKAFNSLESAYPLARIVNLYGPTEATVDVSYYNCPDYILETDKIFIGRPINNTELYIVNENLSVQPVGIKGELLITGVNLASGYINNEELTNTHFIQFNKPNGEQVIAYRTGDIVKLSNDGEIEFIGRRDNQIKIRGIRIELGEIEVKLKNHSHVAEVAVTLHDEKENKSIIAYVVLSKPNSISERKLIDDLKKMISPIMIPSRIIFLEKLPLTSSGKTDRKKLPKPEKHLIHSSISNPKTFYEKKLCELWNNLLNSENIQVDDNFYDIGGNSLLAIKLSMLIASAFSIEPNVISIMEYPTIKDYALYLNNTIIHKHKDQSFVEQENIGRSEVLRRRFSQNRKSRLS